MQIDVRPISESDVAGYHRCLDTVARERRFLAFTEAPPFERSQSFVAQQLSSGAPMVIAVNSNEVVGWCDICRQTLPGFTHRGSLGMGVHPAFRRRGLGRRLMDSALAIARSTGIERVELEVFASNTAAINLYRNSGFALEGTLRIGRKLDGVPEDILSMAIFLQ